MTRSKKLLRPCFKCKFFHVLGGKYGRCEKHEYPNDPHECIFFKRELISLSICLLLLLCSCQSVRYVPIERVSTEKVTEHDSIYLEVLKHDSVYVTSRGDTVFVDRWHTEYRDRWRDRWRDSVRVDSVRVPYPVEKELSWWERQKIAFGEYMILIAGGFLLFFLFRLFR